MFTARFSGRLGGGAGMSAWGLPGGVCQGRCLPSGGVHLPPVNRIIDRGKNITFPQLRLQAVNMVINPRLKFSGMLKKCSVFIVAKRGC